MTALHGVDIEIAYVNGPGASDRADPVQGAADREVVPRLCDAGAAHVALDVTGIESLVVRFGGLRLHPAVGEIVTIDAGPNRGSKVVYLRGPRRDDGRVHPKRTPYLRAACPAEAAVTALPPRPIIVDAKA